MTLIDKIFLKWCFLCGFANKIHKKTGDVKSNQYTMLGKICRFIDKKILMKNIFYRRELIRILTMVK